MKLEHTGTQDDLQVGDVVEYEVPDGGQDIQQSNGSYRQSNQGVEVPHEKQKNRFSSQKREQGIEGWLSTGAFALGAAYVYHQHQKHESGDERPPRYDEGRTEGVFDDNKDKLIAAFASGLEAGAAAIGGHCAYRQHQKQQSGEKLAFSQGSSCDDEGRTKGPLHGNNDEMIARSLGTVAAALRAHDCHPHQNYNNEEEGLPPDAHECTEDCNRRSSGDPVTWVLVDGPAKIPNSAIMTGRDRYNHPIYIARGYHSGSDTLQIGKASPVFREGSALPYDGRVIELRRFEVLVGDARAIRWVPFSDRLDLRELNARPVEGGTDKGGSALYIARVRHNRGMHTAKIGEHLKAAHLASRNTEILIEEYDVLCYN